jgi:predicted acyltransferase
VHPLVAGQLTRALGAPVAAWTYALARVLAIWSVCSALARRGVVVRV